MSEAKNIEELVQQFPTERVSRAQWEGKTVWIKQACAPKSKIWHNIQSIITSFIPFPMIRPTVSSGGAQALSDEAKRLTAFAAAGFHVPRIVAQGKDYLVLSDAGIELKGFLDLEPDRHNRWHLLLKAADVLARLHAAGLAHGRPHLKDFVYDAATGQVGLLDLEEDPLSVMPLEDAKTRDIWLFLCSTARFLSDEPEKIAALYKAYLSQSGVSSQPQLRQLVRALKPLRIVVQRFLYRHVGKDVKYVVIANQQLERVFETF